MVWSPAACWNLAGPSGFGRGPLLFFSPLLQASRSSPAKVVAMVHIAGPPALPTVGASHFGINPVHEDPGIAPLGGTPKEQVPRSGVLARLVLSHALYHLS